MLGIVPELPIIGERPSVSPHNLDTILPDGFQDLRHEGQVVLRTRGVEELVREVLLVVLAKDREAELGDGDGRAVHVVQEVEVQAQVGGRDVDVRLRAVADVPAEDVGRGLVDAVRAVGGGRVVRAGEDTVLVTRDGWCDYSRGVRIDA
jgi:hypothetical protein